MISKRIAGEKAVEYVKDGMILGLGTGSTVYYSIMKLSEKMREGLSIKAVSTSSSTTKLAEELGIPLITLNEVDYVDLTIDGVDEIDKCFNGIKGGGGALLYEKLVALSSKQVIWVADSGKRVGALGKFPLPVEIVPFYYRHLLNQLDNLGMKPALRYVNDSVFKTDENNYIIDLHLGSIEHPINLHNRLKQMPGVIETGLFTNIADIVIIGNEGNIEVIRNSRSVL